MGLDELKALIYHKAGISSSETAEVNMVASVITEVILDFSKRFPWSFLEEQDDSTISLSAGDYQKALPADFLHLVSVTLKDTDNITYPVFSKQELAVYKGSPDLDDTSRPYLRWPYRDSSNNPYLQFHPKSDGSYTVLLRYLQKLASAGIARIPNGLVICSGCMATLASTKEERKGYKDDFEDGIVRMWMSDNIDLEAEPEQELDRAILNYNKFTAGLS